MRLFSRNLIWFFFAVLLSALFSCGKSSEQQILSQLPIIKKAPDFQGMNFDGRQFSSEQMRGKYWLANFFFASCPEVCPRINGKIETLFSKYSKTRELFCVSISVDPDHDRLDELGRYADKISSKNPSWFFLRMPVDEVINVSTKGFGVGHLSEPINHSTRIMLVDRDGMLRGYFDGMEDSEIEKLDGLLKQLLNE